MFPDFPNIFVFRCSIWLAVDVWMCTASILHLVVISLDRYIAVTHPITYPNLMTSKKAKLLIAGAWILSFVICFPPLVGWNDKDEEAHLAEFEFDLNKTAGTLYKSIGYDLGCTKILLFSQLTRIQMKSEVF